MKKFLKEFKEFALKGNVLDMAIGVIIGAAFGKIVTSMVNDILMPLIGTITGGIDLSQLSIEFGEASIKYGNFIQNIIDFLIVAICIFVMLKAVNRLMEKLKKQKEEDAEEEKEKENAKERSTEELLTEIRDLLKENSESNKK